MKVSNSTRLWHVMLEYCTYLDCCSQSGLTPVHVAAFMGHLNIVLLLLQNGASPDVSNIVRNRQKQTERGNCR